MFRKREDLQNPKLRKRVVELRRDGVNWSIIARKIMEEFNISVSIPTARNIFEREIAVSTVTKPVSRDQFKADYSIINERYQKAVQWVDKLGEAIESLYKKLTPEQYMRYAPVILSVCREVLNQLDFIRREQERIQIKQQNFIYSPVQIMVEIHKQLVELEKQGYIRVLKQLPAKEEEEEEEEKENEQISN